MHQNRNGDLEKMRAHRICFAAAVVLSTALFAAIPSQVLAAEEADTAGTWREDALFAADSILCFDALAAENRSDFEVTVTDVETGFIENDGDWWYIEDGRIAFLTTGTVHGTVAGITADWTVTDGKVDLPVTDITYLLENAMQPVGTTLYVWGGGWNAADTAAGETALYQGVYPEWAQYFAANAGSGYSYKAGKSSWESGNRKWRFYGLDCSGFIGWAVYNSILSEGQPGGYVFKSSKVASTLAYCGYGTAQSCTPHDTFQAGDIVSISGHVFLCLGQCEDGSVLIVHSTPNGGAQLSGTVSGGSSSQASELAAEFMKTYYPAWWSCFGGQKTAVSASKYLYGTKFSWASDDGIADSAGLRGKTAEQVLEYLTAE